MRSALSGRVSPGPEEGRGSASCGPDLEIRVNRYFQLLPILQEGLSGSSVELHAEAVAILFDQMVRDYGSGTEGQKPSVRFVEKLVRGHVERIGERHRWMYDRYSMTALLTEVGFQTSHVDESYGESNPWLG